MAEPKGVAPDIICILNGAAGLDPGDAPADKVKALFDGHGANALVWTAARGAEIATLAQRAAALKPRLLVAGGGDGTINCVAQAILDTRIALGVLPMGTLNHFARDVGAPLDLPGAVAAILGGVEARVDVGEVNGRMFLNNSSLGLYPGLVRTREQLQRGGVRKTIAFLRALVSVALNYALIDVSLEADGEDKRQRPSPFVFIGANQYRAEGWSIGTRERLDGGRLWIYLAPYKGAFGMMLLALRALLGRNDSAPVDSFETTACRIETRRPRVDVATDGEVTRMTTPLHYRIRPGALRVMRPSPPSP